MMLQDNVPAFESSEAVAIIERNLGGKLLDKYESFDMQPIAAASLGQVITSGSLSTADTACSVLITVWHKTEERFMPFSIIERTARGWRYWVSL